MSIIKTCLAFHSMVDSRLNNEQSPELAMLIVRKSDRLG